MDYRRDRLEKEAVFGELVLVASGFFVSASVVSQRG